MERNQDAGMDKNHEIAERMRDLREIMEMSVEKVAQALRITPEEYRAYESGDVELHVSIMSDFCNLMNIDLTDLLTGKSAKLHQFTVVRAGEGVGTDRNKAYKYHNLAYNFVNRKMDPFLIEVEPTDSDEIPMSVHSGHEYHYCLKGQFLMRIGQHDKINSEGDSVYFDSMTPHGMKALGNETAKILVTIAQ